jgi:hypothetical protein
LLTAGEGYLHVFKNKLALNPRPDPDNNRYLAKSQTLNDEYGEQMLFQLAKFSFPNYMEMTNEIKEGVII